MEFHLLLFFLALVFGNFLNINRPFNISLRISDCIYLFFIYWAFLNKVSIISVLLILFFAKLIAVFYRYRSQYAKVDNIGWFLNFIFEYLPFFFISFIVYYFSFSANFESLFGGNILFLQVMIFFIFLYLLYMVVLYFLDIFFSFKAYFDQYSFFSYEDLKNLVLGLLLNIALFLVFYDLSQKNIYMVYLLIIGLIPIYLTNLNYNWLFRATGDTIEKVANIIEAKNIFAKGHSKKVAELCTKFANFLGLSYEEIKKIEHSAKIMNLGYISIPEYIFSKSTNLSNNEWRYIKDHPVVAYNVLKKLDMYKDISDIIKYTHENWDGSGYPEGKKANEIPLLSRIIRICDVYLALTEERPYRKAYTPEEALEIIKKEKDKFDPDIFEKFIEFIEKEYNV
ncbi:MAG: HD-GYP domain-containing protein [bacterium]